MTSYKLSLFADYFQIYLMDSDSNEDTSEIWTDEAFTLKLGILPNTVSIGTFRNVDVPLEIEIHDSKPDIDLNDWDHASVGFVNIKSGHCAVFGCTEYLPDAKIIMIEPGDYSLLSLAAGLDSITTEWEEANDLYKVVLWPSSAREYRALKTYENT